MIGEIATLVQGGPAMRNRRLLPSLHFLGGLTGGLVSGTCLGVIGVVAGTLIGGSWIQIGRAAAIVGLLACGVLDVLKRQPIVPRISRQTPRNWSCTLGPRGASFAWGGDLAQGVTTRLHSQGSLLVPIIPMLSSSYAAAISGCVAFGLGRTGVAALLAARPRWEKACDLAEARVGGLRRVAGLCEVTAAFLLVVLPISR